MAVAVVLEFDGDLDQYDEIVKLMGLEPAGSTPPGALFHWVTATSGGVRVTDVWKSREEFDTFAAEKIGPLSAQAGLGEPTKVEFFDVHNYFIES
jgi:hypothetical protein